MSPQNEAIENVPSKNIYGTRAFCYLRFIRNTVRGRFTVQGLIKVKGERKEGGKKNKTERDRFYANSATQHGTKTQR